MRRFVIKRFFLSSVAAVALAVALMGCGTQTENHSTGGGTFKQGNGESDALGPANGNPGPSAGSDPGGVSNSPQLPSQ